MIVIPDLEPCPICGEKIYDYALEIYDDVVEMLKVRCICCDAKFELVRHNGITTDDTINPIERWNERTK